MSTGPSTTDAELVAAATQGDRSAFAAIYDRYANRLHDYCVGMLRDRDAAADCVQDTFCTVATKLGQLRDGDKLRPWLYSIARNEALRHQRERRREEPTDMLPDIESTDLGPDVMATRTELADLVADATGGLSERDRTILDLTYRHDLDGVELADVLGVSKSNAGTLVHRMRDTVERTLGALLVARQVDTSPESCPELAAILDGWDGKFTVLVRKRVARHIETCEECESTRRSMVTPMALLGGTPVFVPAPDWLRDKTLSAADLPSPVIHDPPAGDGQSGGTSPAGTSPAGPAHAVTHRAAATSQGARRRRQALVGTALVGLIAGAAITIAALPRSGNVTPVVLTTPEATTTATPPRPPAQFVPPPPPPPATTTATSLPGVARTAPPTTTPPLVAELPPETQSPTTTAVTTEVTESFSPSVRPTPTEEVETTEETAPVVEEPTTNPPEPTTKTTRRPPPVGPVGPLEPMEPAETTTQPPFIY